MEVHPPEHPIHTWRDFFVHIATIVVGLLIAIALEQSVEWLHHRHIVHNTEANLEREIDENRKLIREDLRHLDATEAHLGEDLVLLRTARKGVGTQGSINVNWSWDSLQSTAWTTARETGALALMPYDTAQGFAVIYGQQEYVNNQAIVYIRGLYQIDGPLSSHRSLSDLQPADLDNMITSSQQTLSDLTLLRHLLESLDRIYKTTAMQP